MSKYDLLWEYIKINAPSELSFDEARSYSMTACVQAKTIRSTGDIAA